MIILNLHDQTIRKTIEIAIEMGKIVLIENITDKVDIHIESLVKQEISRYEDTRFIKFCRKKFKLDPGFGLFLITSEPKPHFDVNLTNYSTMVNFYVTVEGLSQNLLDLIVANERKDLENNYNNSIEETYTSVKRLKVLEAEILKRLKSEEPLVLLADDTDLETLKDSA
jgi:dynein heavy chain